MEADIKISQNDYKDYINTFATFESNPNDYYGLGECYIRENTNYNLSQYHQATVYPSSGDKYSEPSINININEKGH